MMGCGKSEVGRRLAGLVGMEFIDLDAEVERQAGCSVSRIFEVEGEAGFRARERAAVEVVAARPGAVVAAGGGVVLDPRNVEDLRRESTVVWLQVSPGVAAARLGSDTGRPVLAGREGDLTARLSVLIDERAPAYERAAHLAVDGEGTADEVAHTVAALLGAHPAEVG